MIGPEQLTFKICSLAVHLTNCRLEYEYPGEPPSDMDKELIFGEVLDFLLHSAGYPTLFNMESRNTLTR